MRRFNYCLDDALEFHFSQQSASSARKNSCSKDSIEGIFKSYTYEDDPDVIYDEKLQAFLNDVGVNPSNLDALVVFRNLNCQNPGELTKQEFVEGFFSHKYFRTLYSLNS